MENKRKRNKRKQLGKAKFKSTKSSLLLLKKISMRKYNAISRKKQISTFKKTQKRNGMHLFGHVA